MRIFIDADGCPVVQETISLAYAYGITVVIVCDYAHEFQAEEGVQVIICDQGKDSVDFQILKRLADGDILITQDYGLAQLALTRNCFVISQNGMRYQDENISELLAQREHHAMLRHMGLRTPHAKKRTKQQNRSFVSALEQLILEVT